MNKLYYTNIYIISNDGLNNMDWSLRKMRSKQIERASWFSWFITSTNWLGLNY